MEVGAVKQAFNNELILLKKKLNQAKIHVIHKLTRKAKTLLEKKPPEPLKEKLKRKAESAVKEVMIIKKIKARDIGKFIITHKGKLQDYLNKPQVDMDKACARLLLHKVMQEKYDFIRNRFLDVPIKDLFMSRQERLKLKKEAREKQKEKKKGKGKAVNAEGDWDVEDVQMTETSKDLSEGDDNEEKESDDEQVSHDDGSEIDESGNESESTSDIELNSNVNTKLEDEIETDNDGSDSEEEKIDLRELLKIAVKKESKSPHIKETAIQKVVQLVPSKQDAKKKSETKHKVQGGNKNKNLNEKLVSRKFKKDSEEAPIVEKKIVDPFFITATGDNYLTIAEPRQPDEVKEVHKQGNRKLRRAVMFGHVPKNKPRQDFRRENDRFNNQNGFEKRLDNRFNNDNGFQKNNRNDNRFSNRNENDGNRKTNFKDNARPNRNEQNDSKPEKLHPSWEAKKKQSGILPFQGKKIIFD